MYRSSGALLGICLVACQLPTSLVAQPVENLAQGEDGQLLEGLRQRGLFEVARTYCQERLGAPGLSMGQRTWWTMEWTRTHAQHALSLPAARRAAPWQQARKVAADYLQRYPRSPHRVLVQFQDALTSLARGELLRQEAEVAFQPAETLVKARSELREAVRGLEQLETTITGMIPGARNQAEQAQLSQDRLVSLQHRVQYQLARAYRNQGLSYPARSADRIAALQKALDQLAKPLTQLSQDDVLVGLLQRDQATCLRWLGKLSEAQKRVMDLHQQSHDPQLRLQARAELIWIALAGNRLDEALELVKRPRQIEAVTSAELDLARLDTSLRQWEQARQAKQSDVTEQWQQRSVAMVRFMETEHGPYWGRRAETRLLKVAGRDTGNLEILHRTADELYLKGKLQEALAAYEQAANLAQQSGATQQSFQLWYKAALVEQKRNQWVSYTERLRKLARLIPDHPQASRVHLRAIQAAYQQLKDPGQDRSRYHQLLEEHLVQWPQSTTTDQARVWLGNDLRRLGQLDRAMEAYQGVSVEFPQYMAVLETLQVCWLEQLKSLPETSAESRQARGEAIHFFESVVLGAEGRLPRRWSAATRYAALVAARLRLQGSPPGWERAETMLRSAQAGEPTPGDGWRISAAGVQVVLLAGQGKQVEADAMLRQLGDSTPTQLLEMMVLLASLNEQVTAKARTQLASLQVTLVGRLQDGHDQLSKNQQLEFSQLQGKALAGVGRLKEALQVYSRLARDYPRSGTIQEGYADLLSSSENREDWQRALQQWRRVGQFSPPRSPRWYRAKYQVAETYLRLGQPAEAVARIRYLQATTGLEGSGMQDRFEALLKRCQSR